MQPFCSHSSAALFRFSRFAALRFQLWRPPPYSAPVAPHRGPCPGSGLSIGLDRGSVPTPDPCCYLRPPLLQMSLGADLCVVEKRTYLNGIT